MFKKVIYNTASQVVAKLITATSSLLITIIIGRSLGPAGYGDFTKIFTFVGYFYTIADFGFNAIYIKLTTGQPASTLIRALVGLRLIVSAFLAAVAILTSFILPYSTNLGIGFSPLVKVGIIIASLTIVTQALFTSANAFFQKSLRYDFSAIASVVGTGVILITTALAALLKAPFLIYALAYVLGGVTFVIVAYFIILNIYKVSILPEFSKISSKRLINDAWPIGIALFFNLVYFRVDILILSYSRQSAQVGLYGLAYQFFEAALAIPIFFSNALYPLLANLFRNDKKEYNKQIKFWSLILLVFSIALSFGLYVAAFFIPILLGSGFAASQAALRILALGMPFFFVSALFWHMLIIHNKQKTLITIYAVGAIFNVLANLVFIPKYGFLAASTITVVSEALITTLLIIALKSPFSWHNQPSPVAPDRSQ
jgi:O-antigen/teichoic acid export membrane protein